MIIRKATLNDRSGIEALNEKFLNAYLSGDFSNGYVKNKFTLDQLKALIENDEVVVAEDNERVVGYYLTNSIFESELMKKRKSIVLDLVQKEIIPGGKYVFQTQVIIDHAFMHQGIAKMLLKKLKEIVSDKFDFLTGYIDVYNTHSKKVQEKSGWKIIAESDGGWIAMTRINT